MLMCAAIGTWLAERCCSGSGELGGRHWWGGGCAPQDGWVGWVSPEADAAATWEHT